MPAAEADWRDDASCVGRWDLFFPEPGDTVSVAKAEAMCAFCPVIEQCRTLARANREEAGVWAGKLRVRSRHD